jgi:hypothetical protein
MYGGTIRGLPHAVASARRVMFAALPQSIVRALSNPAARAPVPALFADQPVSAFTGVRLIHVAIRLSYHSTGL